MIQNLSRLNRDIFVSDFNIHFGYPRSDTCSTCNNLPIEIDETPSEQEKIKLKEKLHQHQALAQTGYGVFHFDQQLCKKTWDTVQK